MNPEQLEAEIMKLSLEARAKLAGEKIILSLEPDFDEGEPATVGAGGSTGDGKGSAGGKLRRCRRRMSLKTQGGHLCGR